MGTTSTASLETDPGTREVVRCAHCSLVQFRTQNSHCRRCLLELEQPLPEPVAAPAEEPEPPGSTLPDVAGAIRHWRRRRGLSQRELAERMHVPRTYVSKIENDKATPTLASLQRMATAMDTSIATLLQSTGSGAPPETIRELMQDGFIRDLVPMMPHLGTKEMNHLLAELRQRSSRQGNRPQ